MTDVISIFLYSRHDTFSRSMLQDINSVAGNNITSICVNNPEVKRRVLANLGDIQIPALVVKDVEGNVDIITGKKLQEWIRGLLQYSQTLAREEPEVTQLNYEETTPIQSEDEMPVIRDGETPKEFQIRINEYFKRKNQMEREKKDGGRINIGAIISQAEETLKQSEQKHA